MRKWMIPAVLFLMTAPGGANAFASAFAGTTDYYFERAGENEFYNRSEQPYNFEGEIPPELRTLYDFAAPTVYTSEYGANVIPSGDGFAYAPGEAVLQPLPASYGDAPQTAAASGDYPDTWAGLVLTDNLSYSVTPVGDLRGADGSIGRLKIPALGLDVKVYDGDELAAMKKGVGHIEGTSAWDSNVGMVGHNRGTNDYFGKLKTLSVGDVITYETGAGTRAYSVTYVGQIDATDWSMLQYTPDNRLTLITCVENVPDKRVVAQAVETQ
jgi:LPXTG-site transpeptidase (sortase) family protein